jgi:hypothetical protein
MIVRIPITACALLCASLFLSTSVKASYDPVAAGTTKLTLDKQFSRLLAKEGVRLIAKAGARRRGQALILPAVGGKVDPEIERAEIENGGTLLFKRGRRRVVIRRIEVKTSREPLTAKVGGSQLKVARAGRTTFQREGFGAVVVARPLRLTAKVATRLGKKLRLRGVFAAGQRLGTLRSEEQPETLAVLPAGRATFVPAPEFLAKLDSLFVSLNPVAPAERAPGPVFSLPIGPEGTIAPDAIAGLTKTAGALEFLQLGSGQVFWQDLWLDLATRQVLADVDVEPSPTLPGKVGRVPVAVLGVGAVSPDPVNRTVTLNGAPLALSPESAAYFNQAFNTTEFAPGEPLGSLAFTAQTQ